MIFFSGVNSFPYVCVAAIGAYSEVNKGLVRGRQEEEGWKERGGGRQRGWGMGGGWMVREQGRE